MSLFALIFSIGILVDDAIVVVENIHRHGAREDKPLSDHPGSRRWTGRRPDHPGHAHGDRRAAADGFVSGLMGPYMSPIPINAIMGMLSLAMAFVVTPWLCAAG